MLTKASCLLALTAILLNGCEGPDIQNPPPMAVGPAGATTFSADQVSGSEGASVDPAQMGREVCERVTLCLGGDISDQGLEQCIDVVSFLARFLISPAGFVDCFKGLSCEEIGHLRSLNESINQCMDVDPENVTCSGDKVRLCNKAGQCKELDCAPLCIEQDGQFSLCCPCIGIKKSADPYEYDTQDRTSFGS